MAPETLEDGLPAVALLLRAVLVFGLECLGDAYAAVGRLEVDSHLTVVPQGEHDAFVRRDVTERTFELEAERPVLRLHAVSESTAYDQVQLGARTAPVLAGEVPRRDVVRRGPCRPGALACCVDVNRNRDLQPLASVRSEPRRFDQMTESARSFAMASSS